MEAKCKVFIIKISFNSYANKTNFHMKSFALSLAFIVRFTATRKWPISQLLSKRAAHFSLRVGGYLPIYQLPKGVYLVKLPSISTDFICINPSISHPQNSIQHLVFSYV